MTDTLRIGLVTETYLPEVNGVAMTLGRLVSGLEALGHQLQVVRPAQGPADRPRLNGVHTEVLTRGVRLPMYRDLQIGFPAGGRLQRLWGEQRPDVLYIATEGPLGWSAARAARRHDVPVLSGFHTNFDQYSDHYRLQWLRPAVHRYLRNFHRRTAATLVPTEALGLELADKGFGRMEVLSRGVDTGLFSPERRSEALRHQWGLDPDQLAVLYVGRIAPEKGLDDAVTAFEGIRRSHPAARFLLVGDGPLCAPLAQAHPDFIFCGVRRGEELARHYASADLFLFPSRTETFGNVVLEAMASGLPVVAYDYAAARMHIRHGENGVVADFGDPARFAALALELAGQPGRLPALGASARRQALTVDWQRIVNRFSELLRSCAARSLS